MTEVKFFQARDRMTHIPVMCTMAMADAGPGSRELRRAGFGVGMRYFLLTNLNTFKMSYDPFSWSDETMSTIHRHIEENWDSLPSASVLDAEFIRGETAAPKHAE